MKMKLLMIGVMLLGLTIYALLSGIIFQERRSVTSLLQGIPESNEPCIMPENPDQSEADTRDAIKNQAATAL